MTLSNFGLEKHLQAHAFVKLVVLQLLWISNTSFRTLLSPRDPTTLIYSQLRDFCHPKMFSAFTNPRFTWFLILIFVGSPNLCGLVWKPLLTMRYHEHGVEVSLGNNSKCQAWSFFDPMRHCVQLLDHHQYGNIIKNPMYSTGKWGLWIRKASQLHGFPVSGRTFKYSDRVCAHKFGTLPSILFTVNKLTSYGVLDELVLPAASPGWPCCYS